MIGIICCCPEDNERWNIIDYDIILLDTDRTPIDDSIVQNDTIILQLDFTPEFVATTKMKYASLFNTLLAFSCPEAGISGMKDKIVSVSMTSDVDFNGIESGENISLFGLNFDNELYPFSEWYSNDDEIPYFNSQFVYLLLINESSEELDQKLKFKIEFESGISLERETELINWR